jgi:hypothetical protein
MFNTVLGQLGVARLYPKHLHKAVLDAGAGARFRSLFQPLF